MHDHVRELLEQGLRQYHNSSFIEDDPVCIPHRYSLRQDIEISGLFAAILAWGQRKTIINKCTELMALFDNAPHDFIINHQGKDLKKLTGFRHRTFNATDLLYFVHFLKSVYNKHPSIESLFAEGIEKSGNVEAGLNNFYKRFISDEHFPRRTAKHIASPMKKSACKRLNMYLRWMVRKDEYGIDFGLWKKIVSSQLVCPCDVHVEKVARHLGLVRRRQVDWQMALELTEQLKKLDARDPVRYDYALFGMGINHNY